MEILSPIKRSLLKGSLVGAVAAISFGVGAKEVNAAVPTDPTDTSTTLVAVDTPPTLAPEETTTSVAPETSTTIMDEVSSTPSTLQEAISGDVICVDLDDGKFHSPDYICPLPKTGQDTAPIVLAGSLSLAAGVALTALARRQPRL